MSRPKLMYPGYQAPLSEEVKNTTINRATKEAQEDIADTNYMLVCIGGGYIPHTFRHDCEHAELDTIVNKHDWDYYMWLTHTLPLKYFFGESGCTSMINETKEESLYSNTYNTTILCYLAENNIFDPSVDIHRNLFDVIRDMSDSQKHLIV